MALPGSAVDGRQAWRHARLPAVPLIELLGREGTADVIALHEIAAVGLDGRDRIAIFGALGHHAEIEGGRDR